MKTRNYFHLAIAILLFSACGKDPVTRPVKFTSTTYETLSTYNTQGKPDNLLKDTLSPALLNFIDTLLPNGVNLPNRHPELFKNPAIGDITITQPSTVYITFVSQGGANNNAIAFYTYPTSQPPTSSKDIKTITYFFPSAGHLTPLVAGDKVNIGNFSAGTSIGFVLMEDAWQPSKSSLNNDAVHFCTNDALNPEVDPNLKKHAVLIYYAPQKIVLIGFEDFNRTSPDCDNDFNDAVIYATVTN
ncbi:MAG: DUF4114 domain-containing protein [Ginsengibacter sp.]